MRKYIVMFLISVTVAFGLSVDNGDTDVITYFLMRDRTAGTVDTGITIANLEMYYIEDQAAISADVFVGAHGAVTDAHTDGECIHIGFGFYRIDWPDAAFDGGDGKRVQLIVVDGDGGAFTEGMEIQLGASVILADTDHTINSLTIDDDTGDALTIITRGGNGNAVMITGNGEDGEGVHIVGGVDSLGMLIQGGANGGAVKFEAVGTNTSGFEVTGVAAGEGFMATGGETGNGVEFRGGFTSGSGAKIWANGTNDIGLELLGIGSEAGMKVTGGATGMGVHIIGGASGSDAALKIESVAGDGRGIQIQGIGSGEGVRIASGTTGVGVAVFGGTSGSAAPAVHLSASAGSAGLDIDGGETGVDLDADINVTQVNGVDIKSTQGMIHALPGILGYLWFDRDIEYALWRGP